MSAAELSRLVSTPPTRELVWVSLGIVAQVMFSMRFIIQWLVSEKARASMMPESFWYFSCIGGLMLLCYALHRMDPVFVVGQAGGLAIYLRNIYFIWVCKRTGIVVVQNETPMSAEQHPSLQ
jgi:lipid-A-disaccharide synthase-like uncharacterized protein